MRLHRFFIEEHLRNKKDIAIYDENNIHQWKDVFRLRSGDKLILLDNSGFEYIAEVVVLAKGKAEFKIIDQSVVLNVPNKDVWVFAALIKKDNFEWILEKGTEIGVSHFVPVLSERSEKKDLNMERAHKIIKEASEQSGRGIMPELHDIESLERTIIDFSSKFSLMAFHPEGEKFDVTSFKNKKSDQAASLNLPEEPVGILVGPEGGWSDNEIKLFKQHNVKMYSLGPQVLRAETAAIVIPSLFLI